MFVWTHRQHKRVQAFDKLVGGAVALVHDSRVVAKLGAAATPLQEVVDGLFLPNVSGWCATVPRKIVGDLSRVALLPLAYYETQQMGAMVDPIFRQHGPWVRLDDEVYSPPHGGMVSAQRLLGGHATTGVNAPHRNRSLSPATSARTTMSIHGPRPEAPQSYATSRPIILVREAVLEDGPGASTAITLHEARHAVDALAWGIIYQTIEAGAASEVHGYGTQRVVLDEFANYDPIWDRRPALVADAYATHGDPARPDYAAPELISTLQKAHII